MRKNRLRQFFETEASSGMVLAAATVIALILANSPLEDSYAQFLHGKVLGLSVQHWINDGLMTIFFFVVGMEIKRELVTGELSSPRRAALPFAAAAGGMIAPALIYFFLNPEPPASRGWGIPMATDIAFAVGVLSLFGRRVPLSLRVFLLALAIVDDLGAVLVIALFYTNEISGPALGMGILGLVLMAVIRSLGARSYWLYTAIGAGVWFAVLRSGIHATVAGVMIGLLTPLHFAREEGSRDTYSPLNDLVHRLHPYVSFGIMPIFALANAGVALPRSDFKALTSHPIFLGVALGLFIGKPIGIGLVSFLAVKLKLAQLPSDADWGDILAIGFLGGVGFTMALFISSLALYPEQELYSKTGILLGSLASALVGALALWAAFQKARRRPSGN
jgi:NhaA family Na+:H+ antiporter